MRFRRKIFKKDVKLAYLYSTAPVQRITMTFKISRVIESHPQILWNIYKEYAAISEDRFFKFFENCNTGYAIGISNVKKLNPEKIKKQGHHNYICIFMNDLVSKHQTLTFFPYYYSMI